MNMGNRRYRAIWLSGDERGIDIRGQRELPHGFLVVTPRMPEDVAIRDMWAHGTPR